MTIRFEQAASGNWYRLRVEVAGGNLLLSVDGTRAVCIAALVTFLQGLPGHAVPFR